MPYYVLYCPSCGAKIEKLCKVEERNKQLCQCGELMKVKITTANTLYRNIKLRHQQWFKERGL